MPKNENILLDVQLIELEIQRLVEEFPDLADDADLRADMVEGSTAAYDVLDRILTKYREAQADANAISERTNRLVLREQAAQARGEAMRRLALRLMAAGDLKSVKLPEGTLSRVKGRESVAVVDESQLPDWAFTVKVDKRVSKKAISDAMDAGIPVPGAYRATGEETLQVR
jgi:hypothetical protein